MPALSLTQLAQRASARNHAQVTYGAASPALWSLPYEKLEPILRRIDDPAQLHEIEENAPDIALHTAPIWQTFIKRDVTNGASKMIYPQNPRNWHKVYAKMLRQEKREKLEAEENLKKAMMGIEGQKSEKKTVFVEKNLLTNSRPKEFVDGVRKPRGGPDYSSFASSRPPKADPLGQIRNAARNAAHNKVFKPMASKSSLPSASSQIKVAPRSMVLEHQKPTSVAALQAAAATQRLRELAPAKSQISRVFTKGMPPSKTDKAIQEARWAEQKKREERLRHFTNPNSSTTTNTKATAACRATTAATRAPTTSPPGVRPAPTAAGSLRPAGTNVQNRNATAPSKTKGLAQEEVATLSPPPRTATASPQKTGSPASGMVKRKRPAGDPFMPTKKGRH